MPKDPWWFDAVGRSDDPKLLGEDDYGEIVVPVRGQPGRWKDIFNPRNPRHWRYWLRSRRRRALVMVELDRSDV